MDGDLAQQLSKYKKEIIQASESKDETLTNDLIAQLSSIDVTKVNGRRTLEICFVLFVLVVEECYRLLENELLIDVAAEECYD